LIFFFVKKIRNIKKLLFLNIYIYVVASHPRTHRGLALSLHMVRYDTDATGNLKE
jgi:hypothetical protein